MAGQRRPMSVNLANPNNHYTKAQIEERESQEANVKKPKTLKCPKWLSKEAATLFRGYAKELLENLPVSTLDAGTLARMCDAEWSYSEASKHKSAYLKIASQILDNEANRHEGLSPDSKSQMENYAVCQEQIAYWTKQMSALEKIARGCAADLGCTIASRCRMIVPKLGTEEEIDPLEQLMENLHVV